MKHDLKLRIQLFLDLYDEYKPHGTKKEDILRALRWIKLVEMNIDILPHLTDGFVIEMQKLIQSTLRLWARCHEIENRSLCPPMEYYSPLSEMNEIVADMFPVTNLTPEFEAEV